MIQVMWAGGSRLRLPRDSRQPGRQVPHAGLPGLDPAKDSLQLRPARVHPLTEIAYVPDREVPGRGRVGKCDLKPRWDYEYRKTPKHRQLF